jgi:hypothetical protein
MNTRLQGISAEDFRGNEVRNGRLLFYTAADIEAPVGFEAAWNFIMNERHNAQSAPIQEERYTLRDAMFVIVCADPTDMEQMQKVSDFAEFMNVNFPDACPLLIFAPHSVCPDLRKPIDDAVFSSSLKHAIDSGFEICIAGEPQGIAFALKVQSQVSIHMARFRNYETKLAEREERIARFQRLEEALHYAVWVYSATRLRTTIPELDFSLAEGVPESVGDLKVGACLGEGSFGRVYKLESEGSDPTPTRSVLKAVAKKRLTHLRGLSKMNTELRTMQFLSKTWAHPNIIKLQAVFHSPTHLLLQLEDGGPRNLYHHLIGRHRRMSASKSKAIIAQLVSAVCHMHLNAKVVHNDLKPENIIVMESRLEACIKIADFDLAIINPKVPSFGVAGTFPFIAPEVVQKEKVILMQQRYGVWGW